MIGNKNLTNNLESIMQTQAKICAVPCELPIESNKKSEVIIKGDKVNYKKVF
jgi:hypothetical protein